jgi:hypothetical protein
MDLCYFILKLYDMFYFVLDIYLYICQFNVLMNLLYTTNKIKWAGYKKIENTLKKFANVF